MTLVGALLGAASLAAVAGQALAWTPPAQALAAATAGKVWLEVTPDPQGAPALARGVVDIDAPPSVLWKIMTDCAMARKLMPSNRGCRVLERDPKGKWDVREHIMKTPIMPAMKAVFRTQMEPQTRLVFEKADGGDMKVMSGEWRLQALDGGKRTRVSHEMRMQPNMAAPGILVRSFIKGEVTAGLANLRKEAEAMAKTS